MLRTLQSARIRTGQRGFSLIELMIAVLIALFLLGGLVTLVMGTRRSGATQTAMSQLQDNQRIAMTMITNIIQKSGYFPDPVHQQLSSFPVETIGSVNLAIGQPLGGTYNAAAPGDTFAIRFFAPALDTNSTIINCAGQSNTARIGRIQSLVHQRVPVANVNGTHLLAAVSDPDQRRRHGAGGQSHPECHQHFGAVWGRVEYGRGDDYSVLQYLNAGQMTATNWLNVTVVKVTLTFLVPAYGTTGGQMTTNTSTFTRVIPIMSRAGVNT